MRVSRFGRAPRRRPSAGVLATVVLVTRPRFFHGGVRGLGVGEYVLPADETGALSVSGAFGAPYRTDSVYVTTDQAAARSYAALTIPPELIDARRRALRPAEVRKLGIELGGAVYEVEPIGELTADVDEAGRSWEVRMAKIIRVVDAAVPLRLKDLGLPTG
jgi:hypothetical protein